ncbi:hypothetical protein Ac2012v2_003388 [Leucoagaricus gongylophorus]
MLSRELAYLSRTFAAPVHRLVYSRQTGSGLRNQRLISSRRWATSVTPHSTTSDPAEAEAVHCLEKGTTKLEEGDVQAAKELYKRSVEIKKNASSLFNLGVTHYHLKEYDDAISAWKESITLQPSSPDAHTSIPSTFFKYLHTLIQNRPCKCLHYITWYVDLKYCPWYLLIVLVPRPDLALRHLQIASSLSPEDPEIAFNHAAVLEATGRLEEALEKYKISKEFGIERAAMHIRNVSAKILGKRIRQEENADTSTIKPSDDNTT